MKKNTSCSKTYYVAGMHCLACELLLEKTLSKQKQIQNVHASLSHQTITVDYHENYSPLDTSTLSNLVTKHGYSISQTPRKKITWTRETVVMVILILASLYAVYLFVGNSGIFNSVAVNDQSPLVAFVLLGVLAGISSCAALVGGLLLSLTKKWSMQYGAAIGYARIIPTVLFLTGRVIFFVILGGLLGFLGDVITLSIPASAVLVIAVSVIMLVLALQMLGLPYVSSIQLRLPLSITRKLSDETRYAGKFMPLLAGAGTFFLPCGFTLLAQSVALVSGSFLSGALIMGAFALGTLPALAAIGIGSSILYVKPKTAELFSLVAGVIIAVFSIYTIKSQLLILGFSPGDTNTGNQESIVFVDGFSSDGTGVQLVQKDNTIEQQVVVNAKGFSYFPPQLVLKAGIPTQITVQADNVIGCAQALYMPGLYDDVILLNKPTSTASFTPEKGTYAISCSMGMVEPIVVTVI